FYVYLKYFYETVLASRAKAYLENHQKTSPISVCTESCFPGYFKRKQEGKPFCCYDCPPCPKQKMSIQKGYKREIFDQEPKIIIPEMNISTSKLGQCATYSNGSTENTSETTKHYLSRQRKIHECRVGSNHHESSLQMTEQQELSAL
ncbi:hypothetical protein L345_12857, partial [Ophiophagus hannah]